MKKFKYLIPLFSLFFSFPAWSLLISDVGAVDTFLTSADLGNSGDAAEESWIEGYLGFDVTLTSKYDSNGSDWTQIEGEDDVFATALGDTPDYFFIKIGTGGVGLDSHYLFENIGDLSWAVVDFSDAGIDFSIKSVDIGRMSHVGEIDASTSVPEPSIIALFGLGLIALGFKRKKM